VASFLSLVNRTRRECGISSSDLPTLQGVLSLENRRFVDWVKWAWVDLQIVRPNWQWMRKTTVFPTALGQANYTLAQAGAADLGEWITDTFRSYLTTTGAVGEQTMEWFDYPRFRDMYQFSSMRTTTGFPLWFTTNPDHSLAIWPLPADAYTIEGQYYRAPVELSADLDDPVTGGLPERFNAIIVFKAMQSYGFFAAAPEVEMRGQTQERKLMQQLETWGLSTMEMAGPLA